MFDFLDDWGVESDLAMIALPVWLLMCAGIFWVFGYWADRGFMVSWGMRIIIWIIQLPITYFILMYFRNKD